MRRHNQKSAIRRKGIELDVAPLIYARLEAIVADRNRRQKHVERARIVLLPPTYGRA
jgi:hypothetical protein